MTTAAPATRADRPGAAERVVFEHSGHSPFIEEPEPFWATVQTFLERK